MCDNNTVFKPMDDLRLGFYYNLLTYSIGIILSVFVKDYYLAGFILNGLICILPLTLLITDSENFSTNYILTAVFPFLIGLWGIGLGSFLRYFIQSKLIDKKKEEILIVLPQQKYDNLKKVGKCSVISVFLFAICFLYILDITIPFAVYFNPFLMIHFFVETFLFIIIVCLSMSFGLNKEALLWSITGLVVLSILLTIFFIFKIINENYFWNFLFIVHAIIIITIFYSVSYTISFIKCIISYKSIDEEEEKGDQNLELIEMTSPITN